MLLRHEFLAGKFDTKPLHARDNGRPFSVVIVNTEVVDVIIRGVLCVCKDNRDDVKTVVMTEKEVI